MNPRGLLAAIVTSSDDAIVTKNLDGVITSWNAAAEQMFGYTADEAVGKPITLIIPAERLDEERYVLSQIRAGHPISHFETVRVARDGRRLNISLSVSPVRDEEGRIVGASKIARDVTGQKVVAERLMEEAATSDALSQIGARLASTLHPGQLVQAVVDAGRAVTGATIAACCCSVSDEMDRPTATCGTSPRIAEDSWEMPSGAVALLTSMRHGDVLRAVDLREAPLETAFACGDFKTDEMRSYLAVPISGVSGEVQGGLCFGHTLPGAFTDRHQKLALGIAGWAAVALQNASLYQRAQASNRAKDAFLATLSHELRTPLNAILGWAQLLGAASMNEEGQKRAIATIERNARLQVRLIEELLDVSRIVAGKLAVRHEPVDLVAVVAAAMEDVRPMATAHDAHLHATLAPTEIRVSGDATRLQQVIWNLLSNAVKFSARGGRVFVSVVEERRVAKVTVTDFGAGIAPEFLTAIFERFRQVDASPTRRRGGLGLGLGIVKHLVEAHGGDVTVASEGEGKGAMFTVTLPVLDTVAPEGASDVTRIETVTALSLSGVRVLVVDDEPDAVELVAFALQQKGATVVTATSVPGALHALERETPDVLISDIAMPDRDGCDLIETIRRMEAERGRPALPAIALTAYASQPEKERILCSGFGWHLAKPVNPLELVALVERVAGR